MRVERLYQDPVSGFSAISDDKNCAWTEITHKCYSLGIKMCEPHTLIDITPDWALPEPLIIPVKPKFSFSL